MQRLLKCPFCGGIPYLEDHSRVVKAGKKTRAAYVRCTNCGARTGWIDCEEFSRGIATQMAIDGWNRRVDL